MSKTYHLFISHSWTYSDAYEKLLALLNKDAYFSYKNYSVPQDVKVMEIGHLQDVVNMFSKR